MNTNVALSDLASCGTRLIGAKLFRRVHRLCLVLHTLQHAYERLVFQVLLPFSPVSDIVGELPEAKQLLLAQEKRSASQNVRKASLHVSHLLSNDKLEAY